MPVVVYVHHLYIFKHNLGKQELLMEKLAILESQRIAPVKVGDVANITSHVEKKNSKIQYNHFSSGK